jgi:cyclic pyranopterin phosphate synthase
MQTESGGDDSMAFKTGPGGGTPGSGSGDAEESTRADRRRGLQADRIRRPRIVDLTDQPVMPRRATAEAEVALSQETLSAIIDGTNPKGDVLSVAELAGVMGGKRTSELIPLRHPIPLTDLLVKAAPDRAAGVIRIQSEAATTGPADVEMEALMAVAVAALTVYDMIKEIEPAAAVRSIRVTSRAGGDEEWRRPVEPSDTTRAPRGARIAGRIGGPAVRTGPPRRPSGHR